MPMIESACAPKDERRVVESVKLRVQAFYEQHEGVIKESHGWAHARAVHQHAYQAIQVHQPTIPSQTRIEIELAALLHDVDDRKYFPSHEMYQNACKILSAEDLNFLNVKRILFMISLVSCSQNGNSVPAEIHSKNEYFLLIPRWADRLEAVGKIGVLRCYQYNQEHQRPMSSPTSPRPQTIEELWELASPSRFEAYQKNGSSTDMISHYYDKLLHIACPPKDIVCNPYLESQAEVSAKELIEVCLRFGRTGKVDVDYIQETEKGIEQDVQSGKI